jgi:hypothetical protein
VKGIGHHFTNHGARLYLTFLHAIEFSTFSFSPSLPLFQSYFTLLLVTSPHLINAKPFFNLPQTSFKSFLILVNF